MLWTLTKQDTTYIDVGANIGLMSVPILAWVPSARVWSFEPSPASLVYLQRTVGVSRYRERWRVIPKAACDQVGQADFYTSIESGGAMDGFRRTGRVNGTTQAMVECTTLDRIWTEQGRPRVSCIKIDVEGSELEVLAGGERCIESERPAILLEWNAVNLRAYDRSPGILLDYARAHDFAVVSCRHFSAIETQSMLTLAMQTCENFLLLPR